MFKIVFSNATVSRLRVSHNFKWVLMSEYNIEIEMTHSKHWIWIQSQNISSAFLTPLGGVHQWRAKLNQPGVTRAMMTSGASARWLLLQTDNESRPNILLIIYIMYLYKFYVIAYVVWLFTVMLLYTILFWSERNSRNNPPGEKASQRQPLPCPNKDMLIKCNINYRLRYSEWM